MQPNKVTRKPDPEPERYIRPADVPEPHRRIVHMSDDSGCSATIDTHFMLDDLSVNIHGIEHEVEL